MKGRHIYDEIKKAEDLRDELNQALNGLEDADMRNSTAYSIIVKERDKAKQVHIDLLNKEWEEAPTPKFDNIF